MGTRRLLAFSSIVAALSWSACGGDGPVDTLEARIRGLDAEEALALANEWRTTEPSVGTTLTAEAVVFLLPGGRQVSVPLPADTMVLAVAPYVTSTHECQIHSIDGCGGEMAGVPVWVHAETPDGAVLVDESMTPMDNGFIELWLPRDSEIDLSIEAGGLAGGQRVTTFATSDTCIAQIRLQ
ncbi:MAG: CueP family metal-binding protein [Planctomycetes bacterium]|nr:CueP family metal-binding protein [Planctomycetota bacterium]